MPRGAEYSCLTGGVFDPVSFYLSVEAFVQVNVSFGFGGGLGSNRPYSRQVDKISPHA